MTKLKTLLLKSHFLLIALVVINFAFKNLLSISLNYQFVFILKVLIYISGFLLLFFHLKPLKKITIYFSFYVWSPIMILIAWLIDGIFGAILASIFLFFFMPDDSRLKDSDINIYKKFGGFMAMCCNYEITESKLLIFEKKIADFSFEENLYFKKENIHLKENVLEIRMNLKEYDFNENNYYGNDTILKFNLK